MLFGATIVATVPNGVPIFPNTVSIFPNGGSIFPNGGSIFPNGGSFFSNGVRIFPHHFSQPVATRVARKRTVWLQTFTCRSVGLVPK
jgi:hypothetical protein